jgi:alkylhydroperoxidase/carboxymuconolactone decarboxylase family protein YurZ
MKAFGDLGRAATAEGAFDKKTKELIALAPSLAVCRYGGLSLMYAANAIKAFDEVAGTPKS